MAKATKKAPPKKKVISEKKNVSSAPAGINETVWGNLPQSERDRLSNRTVKTNEPPELSEKSGGNEAA